MSPAPAGPDPASPTPTRSCTDVQPSLVQLKREAAVGHEAALKEAKRNSKLSETERAKLQTKLDKMQKKSYPLKLKRLNQTMKRKERRLDTLKEENRETVCHVCENKSKNCPVKLSR